MKKDMTALHTFMICAYKESAYLEDCIKSLKNQTVKSRIIIATATPNRFIDDLAEKYGLPVIVNEGESGIVQDWNFAYSKTETPFVTLAHQDDVYMKEYTETMLAAQAKAKHPLIAFSNYCELRDGKFVYHNRLLHIKRLMLLPLRAKCLQSSVWVRRRVLSIGSCICCPSVFFVRKNLPKQVFYVGFRSNEDWEAWEKLTRYKGQFIYIHKVLVAHRIHPDSMTSTVIRDRQRSDEDYQMFRKFWPAPIARLITKVYSAGEKSNEL